MPDPAATARPAMLAAFPDLRIDFVNTVSEGDTTAVRHSRYLFRARQYEPVRTSSFIDATRLRASLAVAAVVFLASCGSGGSDTSTRSTTTVSVQPTTPTSVPAGRAAYLATANALCRTMKSRISALGDPGLDPTKVADVDSKGAAILAETLRKLRALPAPSGDSATASAIYERLDALAADISQLSTATRSGDKAAAQQASATVKADVDAANSAANAYGLTACAF